MTGPDKGGWASWFCVRILIWLNGGQARRISPKRPAAIHEINGLILTGGADIHPSHYKEELLSTITEESRRVTHLNLRFFVSILLWLLREWLSLDIEEAEPNVARDELELDLLDEAVQKRLPVLGICRGEQLINIYFGGSLHQEIRDFYTEEPLIETHRARKWVEIEPGTNLAGIFGTLHTRVNSLHHQSVNNLGRGLRIAAREKNGIIQAIEHTALPFVIGIQWHPEFLPLHGHQRKLFSRLVAAARDPAFR